MMFPTDLYYGHSSILAWYCGLRSDPPILAHLQHGWNPWTGFGRKHEVQEWNYLRSPLPKLVWSTRNLEFAANAGIRNVHAIGAPFVYLLAMLQDEALSGPTGKRSGTQAPTLVYPYHHGSTATGPRVDTEYVEEIRAREGPGVTVCLYWREHDDPEVRRVYEDAGFRVITHGVREDPLFLVRQRDQLLRHCRVVSNRVSTAIWYGALMGCEVEVYGPVSDSESLERAKDFDREQRELWPQLFDGGCRGGDAWNLSVAELGLQHRATRTDLARALGWFGPRRVATHATWAAVSLRRGLVRALKS